MTFREQVRRYFKGLRTLAHWVGWGKKPFGFYIPYGYAKDLPPRDQNYCLDWLRRRWESQVPQWNEWIRRAESHRDTFRAWEALDPLTPQRPRWNQTWFPGLDGAMAYTMVRHFQPRRILEVGSGHSTRFMAQAMRDGGLKGELHSIDPVPRKDIDEICQRVTRTTVDRVPLDVFLDLEANDILFIDGSHILMPGTDVDYLFHEILPQLRDGVVVHVHDIFLPYEYPNEWKWRGYTEQHALAGMIAGGRRFEVLMPNAYVRRDHGALLEKIGFSKLPEAKEASIWLRIHSES